MKKRFAFTLAEVLLTMTIVGVVAALTIPTIMYKKTQREYTAKLKNFYSRMENAILDMQLDKGSFRYMVKPGKTNQKAYEWYMSNIDPYMGHQFVNNDNANPTIYYKDGSSLKFDTDQYDSSIDLVYDVNGDKKPNQRGYDEFKFLILFTDEARINYFGNADIFFGTPGNTMNAGEDGDTVSAGVDREKMIDLCKSTNRSYCTRLLQNDQWEFKSDYPFKF